jgi:deazaflavin-dependent oxidoreductase (nitroreductase family)
MEYAPSPRERVRDQISRYEATDGRDGGTLEGKPVIILTTTGAKTGKIRKTPLIRIEHDGIYAVVASAGGAPEHPAWYRNVIADPVVQLQDHEKVRKVQAREAHGEEKARWWRWAEARWPHLPEYQTKAAGREIPVLVLEPLQHRERNSTTTRGYHEC